MVIWIVELNFALILEKSVQGINFIQSGNYLIRENKLEGIGCLFLSTPELTIIDINRHFTNLSPGYTSHIRHPETFCVNRSRQMASTEQTALR